ncbi:MAG: hypothetical protein QOE24_1148 [Frankiales bacterium]|jgi:hypothetical protein|nr:hypothetical protein [Frankiales bacterium]
MGTSPDQLRQDIERTRAGLTHNVDTLAEKVSPSAVAHRRARDVRGAVSGIKERVMGASDTASPGTSIHDKASGIGSSLSERASSVQDSVASAPTALRHKTQGSPLAAGIVAFGAGLLVSSMLPASDREQQAAVALKERAQPLAEEQAQQLKESLAPMAQDAVDQVKSTAQDAAAATKAEAAGAAGEVADHARDAAGATKADVADHAAETKEELKTDSKGRTVYPSDPLVEMSAPTHPNVVR